MAVAMRYEDLSEQHGPYAVVVPFVRDPRPTRQTFIRRRVIAGLVVLGVIAFAVVTLVAMTGRGGAPASTTAARPDTAAASSAAVALPTGSGIYVVRAGDTLWSIAAVLRGDRSQGDFVEALIAANGGTKIRAGQALRLPATRG